MIFLGGLVEQIGSFDTLFRKLQGEKEGCWGPFYLLEIKDQACVEKLGNKYCNQ